MRTKWKKPNRGYRVSRCGRRFYGSLVAAEEALDLILFSLKCAAELPRIDGLDSGGTIGTYPGSKATAGFSRLRRRGPSSSASLPEQVELAQQLTLIEIEPNANASTRMRTISARPSASRTPCPEPGPWISDSCAYRWCASARTAPASGPLMSCSAPYRIAFSTCRMLSFTLPTLRRQRILEPFVLRFHQGPLRHKQ
jgi:hypothetical protein